jgi:hypothetical protein
MRQACRQLDGVEKIKDVYTERDIGGLGKNFMVEASRQSAIAAYRFFIGYDALGGLMKRVQESFAEVAEEADFADALSRVLVTPCDDANWEQQRQTLTEDLQITDLPAGLSRLSEMAEQISKAKDDRRGPQIIDDYGDAHVPADQDPFVRQTWQETGRLQQEISQLLAQLAASKPAAALPLAKAS